MAPNNRHLVSPSSGSQKSEISSTPSKSRCGQGHTPSRGAENQSFLLPASGGCWHSLAGGHTGPIPASVATLFSPLLSLISLCLPLVRTIMMARRAHLYGDGRTMTSKSLIPSAGILFPYKVTFHRFQGLGAGCLWGPLFS